MVEEFRSMDAADIFKIIFSIHDPRPPMIPRDRGLVGFPVPDTLPTWLTEEDLSHYATKFANNGFYGGLNYYRVLKLYVLSNRLSPLLIDIERLLQYGRD